MEPLSFREMELALWSDTAFLAALDIMDYSLLVGTACSCAGAPIPCNAAGGLWVLVRLVWRWRNPMSCRTWLQVGVDRESQVLAVAIIDFIRQFTWDKQLETWVKSSGMLGGNGKVRD